MELFKQFSTERDLMSFSIYGNVSRHVPIFRSVSSSHEIRSFDSAVVRIYVSFTCVESNRERKNQFSEPPDEKKKKGRGGGVSVVAVPHDSRYRGGKKERTTTDGARTTAAPCSASHPSILFVDLLLTRGAHQPNKPGPTKNKYWMSLIIPSDEHEEDDY